MTFVTTSTTKSNYEIRNLCEQDLWYMKNKITLNNQLINDSTVMLFDILVFEYI